METMEEIVNTPAKELPACPVETTLMLIGDKWKVLILRDLLPGTKRFGELRKSIGHISQKVLTAQLRQMENSGLLNRTVYPEVPPRVEYTLTEAERVRIKKMMDEVEKLDGAGKADKMLSILRNEKDLPDKLRLMGGDYQELIAKYSGAQKES